MYGQVPRLQVIRAPALDRVDHLDETASLIRVTFLLRENEAAQLLAGTLPVNDLSESVSW